MRRYLRQAADVLKQSTRLRLGQLRHSFVSIAKTSGRALERVSFDLEREPEGSSMEVSQNASQKLDCQWWPCDEGKVQVCLGLMGPGFRPGVDLDCRTQVGVRP